MYTLIAVHLFQAILTRRIIKLYERSKEDMAFKNVNDSEQAQNEEVAMSGTFEKRFDTSRWWALVVTGVAYLGLGIYCLMYPAEQVYYMLWVPTSFFVYIGTCIYYTRTYYADLKKRQQEKELVGQIEGNAKEALLNVITENKQNPDA
jgi:ABC-type transport system involved in cytochrome bd biosynthesis fused ATPase/permease subunit